MTEDNTFSVANQRTAMVQKLRRLLPGTARGSQSLPFGLIAIDSHLPEGGLASAALHEVVAETQAALPAAFGFIVAFLARACSPRHYGKESGVGVGRLGANVDAYASPHHPSPHPPPPSLHSGARKRGPGGGREKIVPEKIVLVLPAHGRRQYGSPYGHGFNSLGLDPARAILVETAKRKETLWAMAEALRSQAPAAVAGMIDRLDLKTSQKLHLAAGDAGLPLLLLRPAQTLEASAAATRWRIGTAPAARDRFGLITRPRWHLRLERCRNGRPGEWVVEYDHVAHRFSLAAALADPAFSRRAGAQSFRQAG